MHAMSKSKYRLKTNCKAVGRELEHESCVRSKCEYTTCVLAMM
jgi:hypothetical protein